MLAYPRQSLIKRCQHIHPETIQLVIIDIQRKPKEFSQDNTGAGELRCLLDKYHRISVILLEGDIGIGATLAALISRRSPL